MFLLSGFVLGLFGSLHCIGMCGPIVLAISAGRASAVKMVTQRSFYHLGRAVTYALLGAIFGLLGTHIKLTGMQQGATILIGALIVVWIILPRSVKNRLGRLSIVRNYNERIKEVLSRVIRRGDSKPFFVIGLVNGFLPCGLVYAGLAGAVTSGSPFTGALYMFLFGLGTIPALFAFSFLPQLRKYLPKINSRKLIPTLAFMLGVIFILRGLNLGIPFISPKFDTSKSIEHYSHPGMHY